MNGTSFASPYAAGVAALVLSENPGLTAAQVEARLSAGCVDLGPPGYDTDYGWGFINARNSLPAGPGNDDCTSATDVSAGGTFSGTLRYAVASRPYDSCCCHEQNADVWYRFTPPVGASGLTLHAGTCGTHDLGGVDSGVDTMLSIFSACGGVQLACSDNADACGAAQDQGARRDAFVTYPLHPGQTVFIRVTYSGEFSDTFDSGSGVAPTGPFVLNIAAIPDQGPACPADWNEDQQVNSNDISAFLSTWLGSVQGSTLDADFNNDGQINSNDISAFLSAWLRAVQSGC